MYTRNGNPEWNFRIHDSYQLAFEMVLVSLTHLVSKYVAIICKFAIIHHFHKN